MGAAHSAPVGGAARSGSSDKSSALGSSSTPFVSTPREHEHWLAASAWRVLDDAYVSEYHRKNDLWTWMEKQKKQNSKSANSSSGSSASSGRDEPSDFFEQVYAFLGPHYSGLQTHRLQAIVHEIAQACEAATSGKSMAFKREAFVRRIHLALEAHRNAQQAKAKSAATAAAAAAASASASASTTVATTGSASTAVVAATPNPLAALYPVITPAEQEEELKDLPLSQQLSVRWLLKMLHALRPDAVPALDPAAQASCTALLLQQLLPLLDELSPIFSGGMEECKLGIMEEVEAFLARAFKRGSMALTAAAAADGASSSSSASTALVPVSTSSSSSSATPFPLAAVTSSLLSLAISRSKLSAMLVVLHPLLLAHARASAQPELRALESMPMQPQVLLKRIISSDGPRLNTYLRGATQRRGSMSALTGVASKTGSLVAWGNGQSNGKLGLDQATTKTVPTLVPQFDSGRVISVSAFQNHVLACDADMRVYGWGSNETHRLGFEDVNNRMIPTIVPFFSDKRVVQVATGNEFSAVLTADGTVWCFGDGQNNKLGLPASAPAASKVPVMVSGLGGQKVTAIACGGFHTLAMTASNELFAWGKNNKSVQTLALSHARAI